MKYKIFSLVVLFLSLSAASDGQTIYLENEELNASFQKGHRKADLYTIYSQEDGSCIGIYFHRSGLRVAPKLSFRRFDSKMNPIKVQDQDLPDDSYISSFHQFRNGNIVALLYEESGNKGIELYIVNFDQDKYQLDLKNRKQIANYEISGLKSNRAKRSGGLFFKITDLESDYMALLSNKEFKSRKNKQLNFVIIDSEGNTHDQGLYDFGIDSKDISIKSYCISGTGALYAICEDFTQDRRAGGLIYFINLSKGERFELAKKDAYIANAHLIPNEKGELVIFGTYSEERKDLIKNRIQGTFLGRFNEGRQSFDKIVYTKFEKDLLDVALDGKNSAVNKGDLSGHYSVKFLRESEDDKFHFVIEPTYYTTRVDRNGNVTYVYHAGDVIAGIVDIDQNSFDWIDVISKKEKVTNNNAVGSFSYLDDQGNLCVLFNVNRSKEVSKTSTKKHMHSRPGSAELTMIKFDQKGNSQEIEMMNTRKETGFYYKSNYALRDKYRNQVYLILLKRTKELVAMIK